MKNEQKPKMDFVHLHVHSNFSLLMGLPKIKPLVKTAKERGFSAIALTDYGAMYGAIKFYEACLAEDIKPIVGCEMFVATESRHQKRHKIDNKAWHLVLLAENFEGYQNLMKLSSLAHLEGFYYRPRIDRELLTKYHSGLIALSGCIGGEIPQMILNGANTEKIDETIAWHVDCFQKENFFLELQDHPEKEGQIEVNNALIEASKRTGVKLVATRDVHYLNKDEAEAQDILTCIKDGKTVDEPGRFSMRHVDRSLNTAEDIRSRFKHVEDALTNTVKIAERCNVEIPLGKWHFPDYKIKEGATFETELREVVFNGLKRKYSQEKQAQYKERVEYELKIINDKGYAPYFLVVADFLKWSKNNNVVTTTRGSAAGSLVSYCIDITNIDPMHYKLPFERFLNPFRPSPPDVDADIADYRRDEVIRYVTEKYGADKVAQICTFGTMAARASLRDVGRALGMSYAYVDRIAKLVPMGSQGFPMTLKRALEMTPELKKAYDENADIKRLVDLAQKIEGCARHISVHAAGVVISPTPLTDFTPVQREPGGEKIITQYEMKSVENAGVLKMDFLGLRNLSILEEAMRYVKKTRGIEINLDEIPIDDKKTFEMLSRGETQGVFQLSGSGMTRYLRDLQPEKVTDIMAMVALYRPGPMESIPEYIARKHDPSKVVYLDPRLKDILDMSYGIITYQDDVLLTAINIAGYDWGEADKLRKAMGKKIPEEMAKQKTKFFEGAIKGGMTKEKVSELWSQIEPFAAYGFNKCLAGDTEIIDPKSGTINTIGNLYKNNKSFHVLSVNESSKIDAKKVDKILYNGRKKIYRLKTRLGREIEATRNHRFMRIDGWKKMSKIEIGDRIAVPRLLKYSPSNSLPRGKLRALGYLIAEGNLCHPHGIYFYSKNELEIQDFCDSAKSFSNVDFTIDRSKSAISVYVKKRERGLPNDLFEWIKHCGLWNKKAVEKKIPEFIFGLPTHQLAEFIGALWQGDGCVSLSLGGQLYYVTSSKQLIKQLQHLLLRFGIISTIHDKQFKYRGEFRAGYTLNISKYDNVLLFEKHIGQHLLIDKREILEKIGIRNNVINGTVAHGSARRTKDIIPKEYMKRIRHLMNYKKLTISDVARGSGIALRLFSYDSRKNGFQRETIQKIGAFLKSEEIMSIAESEIYWDEVVDIVDVGVKDTYDLSVSQNHNFIANDIVVHNSHACSYGMVAYLTAYMKANYTEEYMAALLSCESHDLDKVALNVQECEKIGISVLSPDINESFKLFGVITNAEKPTIRFGLGAVKNVGSHISEAIIAERKQNGRFKNIEDFLIRVRDKDLNKKSLESLIKCGALDCFNERSFLLANIENILIFSKEVGEIVSSRQTSLFGGSTEGMRVRLEDASIASEEEKLAWEKELLGLYVSSHPAKALDKIFCANVAKSNTLGGLIEEGADPWACIAGVIQNFKKVITKKGAIMGFMTVADTAGSCEVVVFPKVFEKYKALCEKEGAMIAVLGKRDMRGDESPKLLAERMAIITTKTYLEEIDKLFNPPQEEIELNNNCVQNENEFIYEKPSLILSVSNNSVSKLMDVKSVLNERPGQYNVYVKISNIKGYKIIKGDVKTCFDRTLVKRIEEFIGEGKVEVIE